MVDLLSLANWFQTTLYVFPRLGIIRGVICFSVGIEDVDDLINDLDKALG